MSDTLQGKLISQSYTGILHSDQELPSSGKSQIYDGLGNESSLKVGRSGNGATVSGQLSANSLKIGEQNYPSTSGEVGAIVIQETSNSLGYTTTISTSQLPNLSPNPEDRYNSIDYIDVNSKGLVTKIKEIDYINDPKLITKVQFVNNPANLVSSDKKITGDWEECVIRLDKNVKGQDLIPIGAKTAILYIESKEVPDPARPIRIRASRNPIYDVSAKLYDPGGHRCLYIPSGGTRLGVQCTVAIGDLNNDGTGLPVIYLKDEALEDPDHPEYLPIEWDISVEAYGY
jgi:hypothetical protein